MSALPAAAAVPAPSTFDHDAYKAAYISLLGDQTEDIYDTSIQGEPISLIALFRAFKIPTDCGSSKKAVHQIMWLQFEVKKQLDAANERTQRYHAVLNTSISTRISRYAPGIIRDVEARRRFQGIS